MEFIDLKTQYKTYQKQIDQAISEVLSSGHFIMGDAIKKLEIALAKKVASRNCIATSSGTDSLVLAMKAIGIGPGDEVITVPYTWISPVEVICRLGARPVFVDIDPNTCLMDASQIEGVITKNTKAIVPISLYGQMPDMAAINTIAEKHGLSVIEDAAQSFGATQNGKNSCNASYISTTSFFPTKSFGCCGDGGAVFTNDDKLSEKMKALRVHGAPERYNHQYIGMNARMDTLQAAILLAKLPNFESEVEARNTLAKRYDEFLKEDFQLLGIDKGNTNVYPLYVLFSEQRETIVRELAQKGIPHGVYYPICIHEQPAYVELGYRKGDFPNAEKVASTVFSIPMHPWLSKSDQNKVIETLKACVLQAV